MQANTIQTKSIGTSNEGKDKSTNDGHSKKKEAKDMKPEIIPLHVSCSQRPDWTCGPCRAYGVKKPWELV